MFPFSLSLHIIKVTEERQSALNLWTRNFVNAQENIILEKSSEIHLKNTFFKKKEEAVFLMCIVQQSSLFVLEDDSNLV